MSKHYPWHSAVKWIPELWPLPEFVASNPLADCVDMPFNHVLKQLNHRLNEINLHDDSSVKKMVDKFSSMMTSIIKQHKTDMQIWSEFCISLKKNRPAWIYKHGMPPHDITKAYSWLACQLNHMGLTDESVFIKYLWPVRGWLGWIKWLNHHPQEQQPFVSLDLLIAVWLIMVIEVRQQLANNGVHVSNDVQFFAVCHNTTSHTLYWLDDGIDKEIQIKAHNAVQNSALSQKPKLINASPAHKRAYDWSEINPEWGLVNHKAMIIGPRSLSEHLNLDAEVFLHSYEYTHDQDAMILAGILAGPVQVAHMINMQYFFSTMFPEHFSSGDKTTLNIYDGLMAVQGNKKVPEYGLPIQSLFDGKQWRHQPSRLIVFIHANQKQVDEAIAQTPSFKQLLDNQWLHLCVLKPKI